MADALMEQAERLRKKVEALLAVWMSGAQHAVHREIGSLDVDGRSYPRQGAYDEAAIMRAIARKVFPPGWVWDVMGVVDGTAVLVVRGYEGVPTNQTCRCADCVDCGGF